MPEKQVKKVYKALREEGKSKESAARIAQDKTGEALSCNTALQNDRTVRGVRNESEAERVIGSWKYDSKKVSTSGNMIMYYKGSKAIAQFDKPSGTVLIYNTSFNTGRQRALNAINAKIENFDYVTHKTLKGIKEGKKPDKAFADACEDENYYGMRADIVADRKRFAAGLKAKGVNINLDKVNQMIG